MSVDPIRINPATTPPGVADPTQPATGVRRPATDGPAFDQLLQRRLAATDAGSLKMSGHALERLSQRGIPIDATTMARLNEGVRKAAAKGSRDALVMVDSTAFVVSVANRTVITAVGADNMRDKVFTNIDSAVIT
ncbi:MAG TPA: TIGR02530 family flagellar biosynthesis protein [Gaiellales bacterium]|jgi:flagellar operon protein